MIETKIKPMPYQKWMEFAIDNYNIVKNNLNKVVYNANVYDRDINENKQVSLTLGQAMELCMNTSMENSMRNCVMKAVYTGYGLEKNIKKVMNEFYVI